jgi:hypothetical protein
LAEPPAARPAEPSLDLPEAVAQADVIPPWVPPPVLTDAIVRPASLPNEAAALPTVGAGGLSTAGLRAGTALPAAAAAPAPLPVALPSALPALPVADNILRAAPDVQALPAWTTPDAAELRAAAQRAEAERQAAVLLEAQRQEALREAAARAEAVRAARDAQEAQELQAARDAAQSRAEAEQRAAALRESQQQAAVRQAVAQAEAERVAQAAARAQAEAEQRAAALREAQQQEALRQAAARAEAERVAQAAARAQAEAEQRAAALREAQQQEALRQAAARAEAERVAQAAARAQAEAEQRAAALREAQQREQAERQLALSAAAEARREAVLRAIGRQLDAEADEREAAAKADRSVGALPLSLSTARRGRLWGHTDPNVDLVQYAQAWARKIELNTPADTVRDIVSRPHTAPIVKVALRSDGSVESVSFDVSSGVAEIDQAIRHIIDSQKPYPAFIPSLARQYDVVEIRRTWRFDVAVRLH